MCLHTYLQLPECTQGLFAGIPPKAQTLNSLLSSRPGGHFRTVSADFEDDDADDRGVNFAMFLTMMGERLVEFDTEAELLEAFECFDENDNGYIKVDELRKWLSEVGDRMSEEEVRWLPACSGCVQCCNLLQINRFLNGPFTEHGNFKYREWAKAVRVNEDIVEADP